MQRPRCDSLDWWFSFPFRCKSHNRLDSDGGFDVVVCDHGKCKGNLGRRAVPNPANGPVADTFDRQTTSSTCGWCDRTMRVKGNVVFLVEDEQHLEKGKNVWVNMQRRAIQIKFGANTSLVGKPMLIKSARTIGFVYFFEDEQTQGDITTGATFDLSIAERTLEEVASFPIGETYGRCSVKDNVLCAS